MKFAKYVAVPALSLALMVGLGAGFARFADRGWGGNEGRMFGGERQGYFGNYLGNYPYGYGNYWGFNGAGED